MVNVYQILRHSLIATVLEKGELDQAAVPPSDVEPGAHTIFSFTKSRERTFRSVSSWKNGVSRAAPPTASSLFTRTCERLPI